MPRCVVRTEEHRRSPGGGSKSQHFPLRRAAGTWEGCPCARASLEWRSGALGALALPPGQPLSAFRLKLLRESARITCFLEQFPRSCALYEPCRSEDHPGAQTWGARGLSGVYPLAHPSPGSSWKGVRGANVRVRSGWGQVRAGGSCAVSNMPNRMQCP